MTGGTLMRMLPIASVDVKARLRPVGDVSELAASIAAIGLLNPITVTPDRVLVAGAHRLEACKRLGWNAIPSTVLDMPPEDAQLAEVDENLMRSELTALERAEHLAARKRLYETIHPDTGHGGDRTSKRTDGPHAPVAFAADSAAKLRESARNVRRYVAIAEALNAPTRDALRAHAIADNRTELERLVRVDAASRHEVVAELVSGARSVKEAQRNVVARSIRAETPPLPTGRFRVLVIDPPWAYDKRAGDASHRSALDYPTMTIAELARIPVSELSHDNAVLWLWTTNAFMHDAHHLASEWGFVIKTALTWAKDRFGTGDWLRGQTEHCLLCVRGNPVVELAAQSTLLAAKRREHSRKPDAFYELVEALCPGSKLELFARQPRAGWATWGAEAERFSGDPIGHGPTEFRSHAEPSDISGESE